MDDEIELKLAVAPEHVDRLKRHPVFRTLKRKRGSTKRLVSTYYDTPALELMRKAVALRIRKIGQRRVQSIKSGQVNGASGLARREWERTIEGDLPDLTMLDDPELRRLIKSDSGKASLKPVFVTDVRREVWPLRIGAAEIECAIDVGEIKTDDRSAPLCEVELELKSGLPSKLFELARRLNKAVPLRIEPASKAARGYSLLRGEAPVARKAEPISLDPDMTVREAFAAIARSCVAHILANVSSAHDGTDSEGVHQLRVGIRRLRAAFSLFRSAISDEDRLSIGAELRWLQQELGSAREWDVFIDSTMKIVSKQIKNTKGLPSLLEAAEVERARGYERARAALGDRRYTDLLLRLEGWLELGLRDGRHTSANNGEQTAVENGNARDILDMPILGFAGQTLRERHAKVQKLGSKVRKVSDEQLHDLRIRVKKLRYATEFFRDLHADKAARRYVGALKALQEILGTAHDALVADDLIPRLEAAAPPSAERAIGQLQGWCAAQVKHDRKRLEGLWADFAKLKTFW